MAKFQAPRGTRDLLPADMAVWQRLEDLGAKLAATYGYQPIETPLFEDTEVFERGIGEVTDIVEKELFRIKSPGSDEERWALRPEPTAGICRAYVEHGMHTLPQPVKLTSWGPMFRYDRPQAGRYRQFWQFDVEAIGDAGPAIDAEVIELALRFVREAGVENVELHLNSIGDAACRPGYIAALVDYMSGHAAELPELEQRRLAANPLRLLDTKDAQTLAILEGAPTMDAHLCPACRDHFDSLLAHLASLGIEPRRAPRLVRGLDYYTRTAFELYQRGAQGQQSALGGGGRYDGLIEQLGGPSTPAVGWAAGIERIMLAMGEEAGSTARDAFLAAADDDQRQRALTLAIELRHAGLSAEVDLAGRGLKGQLKHANRIGARHVLILEADGSLQMRDMESGEQHQVAPGEVLDELSS